MGCWGNRDFCLGLWTRLTSAPRALNSGTNIYLEHTLLMVDSGLQKQREPTRPHKVDASAHIIPVTAHQPQQVT